MSGTDADQEPSMEEILASIRKIISEDVDEGAESTETVADEDTASLPLEHETETEAGDAPLILEEEAGDAPLILEEEVEEEPVTPEEEMPEDSLQPVDALDAVDLDDDDDIPPPPLPPSPPVAIAAGLEERIVSDATAAAGMASFAHLEQTIRMGQAGETLEEIVKGLLQPMLRNWLDENLPHLVEQLVQDEIRKMAGVGKRNSDNDRD